MKEDYELFTQYVENHLPDSKDIDSFNHTQDINRKISQASLDLHGLTIAEAHQAIKIFMQTARIKKHTRLMIITGKGNHSNAPGKLRAFVKEGLNHGKFSKIKKFRPGKAKEGGSGVFVVEL